MIVGWNMMDQERRLEQALLPESEVHPLEGGLGKEAAPLVSVIIPCRDEEKLIARCLDSVIENDYPKGRLEVLVVDGMSVDGTRGILGSYANRFRFIRVLDNPKRITPAGLKRESKPA